MHFQRQNENRKIKQFGSIICPSDSFPSRTSAIQQANSSVWSQEYTINNFITLERKKKKKKKDPEADAESLRVSRANILA